MQHAHPCRKCGNKFPCYGPEEYNPDGWPEVVCLAYHEENQDWCENCLGQMLEDQAHDEWWEGIGSYELDDMMGSGVYSGETQ